ncbi:TPA: hypothetical protein DCE37_17085 [Candidatus Latescibacteria bacterium]|nr:hypothetical protein [Candidatus Latescibacterota bacterium]
MSVLCYGVVGVDILLQVNRYPEADGHARVSREAVSTGGEAANTAVRLKQLGLETILMGNPIGEDAYGQVVLERLHEVELDHRLRVTGETGHAYIVSDGDGHRTIFGVFGALTGDPVCENLWAGINLVTVDPFVDRALEVAQSARDRGLPVVTIEAEPDHQLATLSTVTINSAGFLRRHGVSDAASVARGLINAGAEIAIITRGKEGAEAFTGTGSWRQDAVPTDVVDTTGAGDGFRAGVIFGMLNGDDWGRCVAWGTVVASLSCCYFGGCDGFVDREAARSLLPDP